MSFEQAILSYAECFGKSVDSVMQFELDNVVSFMKEINDES